MDLFPVKLVRKDPQARRLFDLEVATKRFARIERPFFKQRADCSHKIIRQRPSEPGVVKQIRSPLVKASPPFLHCRQGERF
jgi:hypothetical protein